MKRLSIIFTGFLVLLSSMIFCACNDGWKNLEISCKENEIVLVLDDDELSKADVIFELNRSAKWDEVSVRSEPQGLVMVENIAIKDTKCGVRVKAIQPSGDGAKLIITHLGADVSCSVPLKVGRKLVDVKSTGKDYVIQPQVSEDDEFVEYDISTKSLIVGVPENYTNNIAWNIADGQSVPEGVKLQSYDAKGQEIDNAFVYDGTSFGMRLDGTSSAVKTMVRVTSDFYGAQKLDLNPVSVLDGKAVLYKDVTISIYILNLDTDAICVTSKTHVNTEGELGDVVIINNPSQLRGDETDNLYNYYSTAILDLKFKDRETKELKAIPQDYKNLYTINTSTNIENLRVEQVGFDSVRITALNSCVGEGYVDIKFVPNEVVGDIKPFEISVPVTCGERATGILATRIIGAQKEVVAVTGMDGVFTSTTMLNDSYSAGEKFEFKILSENTLSGLKKFKITIDKRLLYINPSDIVKGSSNYVKEADELTPYNLTGHSGYKYQICLMNGNRQMMFYAVDGRDDVFESEWLTESNTVYMKYETTSNEVETINFGLQINNLYDGEYNLNNNGFANTCITYNLNFTRQRTIGNITYRPIKVSATESGGTNFEVAQDGYDADWTYYFTREMLETNATSYGLDITNVLGLDNSQLTDNEKSEIDLTISVSGGDGNLGWSRWTEGDKTFSNTANFKWQKGELHPNLLVFGKVDNTQLAYGEYKLVVKQGLRILISKKITIYKQLADEDVSIAIPTANYAGVEYLELADFDANPEIAEQKRNNSYILAIDKGYEIEVNVLNKTLNESPNVKAESVVVDAGGESGLDLFYSLESQGFKMQTGSKGSFNVATGKKNFVKITYTITSSLYDYYKKMTGNDSTISLTKEIYVYIYEPVADSARFVNENGEFTNNIIKYNFKDLQYTSYASTECYQILSIYLNNGSASVFNYVDITWKQSGDGILSYESLGVGRARYKFGAEQQDASINGTIMATIKQFGMTIPIYCGFVMRQPVLTDKVTITNDMSNFNSGTPYISLKVGESVKIEADANSNTEKPVSLVGFEYAICGTNGYATNGVANIDAEGNLTAINAGRVKLIVVAKDRLKADLGSVINYFKFTQYVNNNAYAVVDIIVADGSVEYPYLVATSKDFESIRDDFKNGVNDKFYALVGDVNLNGKEISFDGEFKGGIFSYQEDNSSDVRFSIYGVRITGNNKYIFNTIDCDANEGGYTHSNLENIDVHITFDFEVSNLATQQQADSIGLGFIKTNKGYIKNCQFYVGGWINGGDVANAYVIGTVASNNQGTIELLNESLIGVQGSITVQGTIHSTVLLGGVAGKNSGVIRGVVSNDIVVDGEVEYSVFYGTQGSMADIELQVKSVSAEYNKSAIGGIVGENRGTIYGVYSLGKILGTDDKGQLVVNNVGGIAGRNINNKILNGVEISNKQNDVSLTIKDASGIANVDTISYAETKWQIEESYSSALIYGRDNVGGVVGYDENGEYKRVYYEVYDNSTIYIKGRNNVGGLIGYGKDASMLYCYANTFAWDYTANISVYNIEAENNAGGLVGYGESSLTGYDNNTLKAGMYVVSSASSMLVYSQNLVGGIVGRSNGYTAIYTGYFYGVLSGGEVQYVTKLTKSGANIGNRPYNNVYVISVQENKTGYDIKELENEDFTDVNNKFGQTEDYNNGKPFIKYRVGNSYTNLVSVIPTIIEISASFERYNDVTIMGYNNKLQLYKTNILGEYVFDGEEYRQYNEETDSGKTRYALMAELADNTTKTYKLSATGGYVIDYVEYKPVYAGQPTYVLDYRQYNEETDSGKDRYAYDGATYVKQDDGDYVLDYRAYNSATDFGETEYVKEYRKYVSATDSGKTRYDLIVDGNKSNYRDKVFALYYYNFDLLNSETAILDMQSLNSIDIKSLLLDGGIISKPNSTKRFNVSSSNRSIVNPTSNGMLVIKGEGQATITITSVLNKNASASFVVIVRSKTLKFGLYSSANCLEEYSIDGKTMNVVKNTSKLIYADYSTVVTKGSNVYEYSAPTNMEIRFTIEVDEDSLPEGKTAEDVLNGKSISEYISINGTEINGEYIVTYGTPITITVNEFFKDGRFKIVAKSYIVLQYSSDLTDKNATIKLPLASHYDKQFYVATKKGVSAINTNKTKFDIMPADEVELKVKLNTDIKLDSVNLKVISSGEIYEFEIDGKRVATNKLVDIYYNDSKQVGDDGIYSINISGEPFDKEKEEISFTLKLKVAEIGYYIEQEYKLDLEFSVENVKENVKLDIKPQEISNIMMLNYRMGKDVSDLSSASLSNIVRPGSRNVIVINIAPNIAVYDYLEIVDLNLNDKVLFMQLTLNNGKLEPMSSMDTWIDNGIRLVKDDAKISTLYTYAMLPLQATANETHIIRVTAYNKAGKMLAYKEVNLEAVLFPSVTLTYTYPNGQDVVVDSRNDFNNDSSVKADLAVGVEAGIRVETANIDEESLIYSVEAKDNSGESCDNLVTFRYEQAGYMLRFNNANKEELEKMIGGTVSVTFTASKQVNGVNETCKSTIKFNIRRYVIHGVSMSHTALNGKLYGFYNKSFETEFFFDKTDISYWTGTTYWNIQYRLDNLGDEDVEGELKKILTKLNKLGTDGVNIKFGERATFENATELGSDGYNKNGITISNVANKLQITATDTSKINDMKISVNFGLKFDGEHNHVFASNDNETTIFASYEFYMETQADPFKDYKTVSNQQEFEAMLEGNYYQLIQDITLKNYTPISTQVSVFTGNGKTITIESFNMEQLKQDYSSGDLNIGLFGTIGENTVIQNLVVKYQNSVNIYSRVGINLSGYVVGENATLHNLNIGGISGNNLGVITNCRVLGVLDVLAPQVPPTQIFVGGITGLNGGSSATKIATITKSTAEIKLSGMAMIGGIAEYNAGTITTSIFKGTISSKEDDEQTNEYASSILTAGFVVTNTEQGEIALSAVLTSGGVGKDMYSVGSISGFVSNNIGKITDSYVTDVSMQAQGNIGGFVYDNAGTLIRCYANPSFEASRFYQRFVYNTTNYGSLENCYVITDEFMQLNIEGLTKISKIDISNKDKFNGFIFASSNYGIWSVNAGRILLNNIGYTQLDDYADVLNIYDEETFKGYLVPEQLVDNTIQNKKFNIVRDIDLSGLTDNPATYNKVFSASLDGNGLTISGYNIYNSGNVSTIGLFAKIKQNKDSTVFIRNLTIKPASIKASKTEVVGALAGVIEGGYLYNIQIDAGDVLILGRNAVGGLAGLIKGDFEIIGIQSNISAFSTYAYGVGNQYNLYLSRFGGGSREDNMSYVSYSGSVAGIVDGYKAETPNMAERRTAGRSVIENVQIVDDVVLIAETVGGAFGLVGENTLVSNIRYNLSTSSKYQSVYVSGGLVGENRGVVQNSYITNPANNNCFDGFGRLVGGIVGLNIGGLVYNCSANIYISTKTELSTVGGIVGRNIEGWIDDCIADGWINAYFVGGVIGADYTYDVVNKTSGGYGIPTSNTKQSVLANVKLGVKYANFGRYEDNKVGISLIQNLINVQDSYYSYNTLYNGGESESLIIANSVFGIIVGLTDRDMSVKSNGFENEYLVASLSESGVTSKVDCKISSSGVASKLESGESLSSGDIPITAIDLFEITNLDFSKSKYEFTFLYLIASENATYDYWSSVLGYSNEFVIVK